MNPLQEQIQMYTGHYERYRNKDTIKQQISLPFCHQKIMRVSHNSSYFEDRLGSSIQHQQFNPSFTLKFIIFYLYFLQGIVISYTWTMPYVYKQLPSYDVMTIFSLSALPFTFKFIIAPFIQKYNKVQYGKRKTWIVISQILTSFIIYVSSDFTQFKQAVLLAILLFFAMFFITFQDIALDGLSIKQLKVPHIASSLQVIGLTIGIVFGSLLLLKLTSLQFAYSLGLHQSITNPSFLMKITSVIILIPTLLIHLFFKQLILDTQIQNKKKSFFQVIKQYKIFFNTKSRHFRTSILFLIWFQGINFFLAGYQYELIKGGFSRNILNTISNAVMAPLSIFTCMIAPKIHEFGINRSVFFMLSSYVILMTTIALFFSHNIIFVISITIVMDTLNVSSYLILMIMITSFPVTNVTGMIITMLSCLVNFGRLKTIQIKLLSILGWEMCLKIGIVLQIIILLRLNSIMKWVQEGEYQINESKKKSNNNKKYSKFYQLKNIQKQQQFK